VAGTQVASRRKAHHGSSLTVFHEGSGLSPGDTNASAGVGTRDWPVLFQPRKPLVGGRMHQASAAVAVRWDPASRAHYSETGHASTPPDRPWPDRLICAPRRRVQQAVWRRIRRISRRHHEADTVTLRETAAGTPVLLARAGQHEQARALAVEAGAAARSVPSLIRRHGPWHKWRGYWQKRGRISKLPSLSTRPRPWPAPS
jgi:hypothetical protein